MAVVNEAMARSSFGESSALGRRFGIGRQSTDIENVGVVSDGRTLTLRDEPRRFVYLPYRQSTDLTSLTFYVRTAPGVPPPATAVREAVGRIDRALPMYTTKW